MIRSVTQNGSILEVRDENGTLIGTIPLDNGEMIGYATTFILLKYDDKVIIVDEKNQRLGDLYLPPNGRITGITNIGFLMQTGRNFWVFDRFSTELTAFSIYEDFEVL